jgi:hypothetical protein
MRKTKIAYVTCGEHYALRKSLRQSGDKLHCGQVIYANKLLCE